MKRATARTPLGSSVDRQALALLADVEEVEHWAQADGFARIPLTENRGDVLIRPRAVSAIMPTEDTDG
jgi:hypothetical protein